MGIARVVSGTTAAQAILLLGSLVVARLVSPESFGLFASVSAGAIILGSIVSLRLELAIAVPSRRGEAVDIMTVALIFSIVLSFIAGLGALAYPAISGSDWYPKSIVLLLAYGVLIAATMGATSAMTQMALRDRRYSLVATRVAVQALVTVTAQVTLSAWVPGAPSLLAGLLTGQVAGIFLLRGVFEGDVKIPSKKQIRDLLVQYRRFPLISAPSAVVNTMGLQTAVILGGILWGSAAAGWLGMTQRVLAGPVTVVGNAIGQVFIGEFGNLMRCRDPELYRQFLRVSAILASTGAILASTVFVLAPHVAGVVLGDDYREVGTFSQALALGIAGQVLAGPLSVVLPMLGRQSWQAIWDVTRLGSVVGGLLSVASVGGGVTTAMWWLGGINFTMYVLLWIASCIAVRRACRSFLYPGDPVTVVDEMRRDA